MRDRIIALKESVYSTFEKAPRVSTVATAVLVLLLASSAVVAQVTTESDDFEDGNIDGWTGTNMGITTSSVEGNYSLDASDGVGSQDNNPTWEDGPTLNMSEDFTVEGTMYINQGDGGARVGAGLVEEDPQTGDAVGVLLLFSDEHSSTFIAVNNTEDPTVSNAETIPSDFDQTWVNWEITASGSTAQAKVWEYGTAEPSSYNISREVDPESGNFTLFLGTNDFNRGIMLDSVALEGVAEGDEPVSDEELSIETRRLFFPNSTHDYEVFLESYNETVQHNVSEDVTDSATVTSGNSTVLSVDETNHTLTSINDTNVSQVVNVTVEYGGYTTVQQVVVAEPTVENLEILPTGLWRLYAIALDNTIFALLVAALFSVAAARFAGAFAGLATAEMVIVIGWLAGYIGLGIAMVSVFMCLFIGLNLAANIDYTVSSMRR